jgi:hypothetical protein
MTFKDWWDTEYIKDPQWPDGFYIAQKAWDAALAAERDALRAATRKVVEAATGIMAAIPPIEGHALWSIAHCKTSPASHQEMVRGDTVAVDTWGEAKRKMTLALADPTITALGRE